MLPTVPVPFFGPSYQGPVEKGDRHRAGGVFPQVWHLRRLGASPLFPLLVHSFSKKHNGNFIFVVEDLEDGVGTARRRTVRIGELSGDGLEIVEGLSDGDLLVTAGVNRLVDGRRVRLLIRTEDAR